MKKIAAEGVSSMGRDNPRKGAEFSRPESHLRFTAVRQGNTDEEGAQGPSTVPPPPFQSEAEVDGNEWWLELHMDLAGNLLCLEQIIDAVAYSETTRAAVVRIQGVAEEVAKARDALYDLYCDAADPRMTAWTRTGTLLASYVEGLYRWCGAVMVAYITLASALRSAQRVTAADALQLREAIERAAPLLDDAAAEQIPVSLKALGIDESSPVEPLRNVYKNLEELFFVATSLRTRIARGVPS